MNRRDAINEILLSLNEQPLDVEDNIEDINIAIVVDKELTITKRKILSKGWFFNKFTMDLYPNTEDYIIIPEEFISVDGGPALPNLVVRDWKLFDKVEYTYKFTKPQTCRVIQDVIFDDIPYNVANYIVQQASLKSYINIIGATEDVKIRAQDVQEAKVEAMREDMRNSGRTMTEDDFVSTLVDRSSL